MCFFPRIARFSKETNICGHRTNPVQRRRPDQSVPGAVLQTYSSQENKETQPQTTVTKVSWGDIIRNEDISFCVFNCMLLAWFGCWQSLHSSPLCLLIFTGTPIMSVMKARCVIPPTCRPYVPTAKFCIHITNISSTVWPSLPSIETDN